MQPTFPPDTVFVVYEDDFGATGQKARIAHRTYAAALDQMATVTGDATIYADSPHHETEIVTPDDAERAARECWAADITATLSA